MAPEKPAVQLCFQIFNPFIIIDDLSRRQIQMDFPVDNFAANNILQRNNAAFKALLDKQAGLARAAHGSHKALHRLFKMLFVNRL